MLDQLWRNYIQPVGQKLTGAISSIGSKISRVGHGVLDALDKTPILGTLLAPASSVARGALGVVDGVTGVSDAIGNLISNPGKQSMDRVGNSIGATKQRIQNLRSGLLAKRP